MTNEPRVGMLRELGGGGSIGLGLSLDECEVRSGYEPTLGQRNSLASQAQKRRIVRVDDVADDTGTPVHQWKVKASKLDDRQWRVTVGTGFVNDVVAEPFTDPLTVKVPDVVGKELGGFALVGPNQRPPFFRTRTMWKREIYQASVVISGTRPAVDDVLLPFGGIVPLPPTLVGELTEIAFKTFLAAIGLLDRIGIQRLREPYLVRVGTAPLVLDGTERLRLAWLWLARDPGRPSRDVMFVEQLVFWSLQAFSLLEDDSLLSLLQAMQVQGIEGELFAQSIFSLLSDSARVRWWTKG